MNQKYSDNQKSTSTYHEALSIVAPPPPYSTQSLPQTSAPPSNRPNQTLGFPDYPPQPYHTQAPSRTLHLNYGNWQCTRISIIDTDEHTPLYNIKLGTTKPQMTFESASTAASPIATVIFHNFHTRIDTVIRDSAITMMTHLALKSIYTYASPALEGASLTWKSRNSCFDLDCVDEKGVVVARFHFGRLSLKKAGRLEIVDQRVCDEGAGFLEEIMITGLAFAYYMEVMVIAIVR